MTFPHFSETPCAIVALFKGATELGLHKGTIIQFPQAESRRVGLAERVGGASPSPSTHHFESLGDAADAVIMRLRQRLPRVVVKRVSGSLGEEPNSRSD